MTITLIILAYILNIFIARWLNKICYKKDRISLPFIWFIPIVPIIAFLIIFFKQKAQDTGSSWFTGKYW